MSLACGPSQVSGLPVSRAPSGLPSSFLRAHWPSFLIISCVYCPRRRPRASRPSAVDGHGRAALLEHSSCSRARTGTVYTFQLPSPPPYRTDRQTRSLELGDDALGELLRRALAAQVPGAVALGDGAQRRDSILSAKSYICMCRIIMARQDERRRVGHPASGGGETRRCRAGRVEGGQPAQSLAGREQGRTPCQQCRAPSRGQPQRWTRPCRCCPRG